MARTAEEYKQLSIKEFTRAAKVYETQHAGIYEMCRDDYPQMLAELEREPFSDVLDVGCGTGAVIEKLPGGFPPRNNNTAKHRAFVRYLQQYGKACAARNALTLPSSPSHNLERTRAQFFVTSSTIMPATSSTSWTPLLADSSNTA